MKKKILSCLLAGTMVLGMLSGCGKTEVNSSEASQSSTPKQETTVGSTEASTPVVEEPKEITYPLEGNVKLTIGVAPNATVSGVCAGWAETAIMKEWQKQTGVEIEFVEAKDMNLLLAGGDMPDIIVGWDGNSNYPGGWSATIKDKVIQPITEYYEEFAPDYAKLLAENPEAYLAWTEDGDLFGFGYLLETNIQASSSGMIIRQDWLDDLGMKAPTNHEELYEVLKAFKEKKGAEYPLGMSTGDLYDYMAKRGMMTSSFGLAQGDYHVIDGVVQPCYVGEEYKEVVTFFNKLYNEGLLDPNCAAVDSATKMSNFLNGKSGMMFGAIGSGLGSILEATKDDPNFKAAGVAPFKTPEGDVSMCAQYTGVNQVKGAAITTACKDIEAACKFLNYGYTEAGLRMFNFGIEGVSYEMVNGSPTYIDETIRKNPDMTPTQAMYYHTLALIGGPFMQQLDYLFQYNNKPEQQEALENWSKNNAGTYVLPKLTMNSEDAATYNSITADINTYTKESFAKFVIGEMSLDDWDKYEKQVEAFGLSTARDLNQKYYDELMK